jgi:predicted ribosome quality control (RQC) complex YloA/Tae2 family protein
MDSFFLSAIVPETGSRLVGRAVARLFLSGNSIWLDFRLPDGLLLHASLNPSSPALYLSRKSALGGKQDQSAIQAFGQLLRKHLSGAKLVALSKEIFERIVNMSFEQYDSSGSRIELLLKLRLTGRSSNAFLFDNQGNLLGSLAPRPDRSSEKIKTQSSERAWLDDIMAGISAKASANEVIARVFGPDSLFSPLMKTEFLLRSETLSPREAIASLFEDLKKPPVPILYSRQPLDEAGERLSDEKPDLILTHIEMVAGRGLYRYEFDSLSEAADEYYRARRLNDNLRGNFNATRHLLVQELRKKEKASKAIRSDRERFEDPDRYKRYGDLILANLATARQDGTNLSMIDYYDPEQRMIQIEIPAGKTLKESAAGFFTLYQKARRAKATIEEREATVEKEIAKLRTLIERLEREPDRHHIGLVREEAARLLNIPGISDRTKKVKRGSASPAYGRRFLSSDGYEIVVGRNDRENDHITFKLARPADLWLHAADYPGSHVVVRNPARGEIPMRTILEAAEVAAFYSQAKSESKAAVHYTQRKFISKPPRAKPGLVRLSSFKSVLVEPRCEARRIE